MRQALWAAGRVVFFCLCSYGQETLTFEVASVKRSPPAQPGVPVFYGPARGGPGTADPEQITWSNAALRNILMTAYDVQTFQVNAPDWMTSERYDIVAKVPPGANKKQVSLMWQNLLAERFGMKLHRESKEFQVDELTVAKGGSKLKETDLDPNAGPFTPTPGPPKLDGNGVPMLSESGFIVMITGMGGGAPLERAVAKGQTLSDVASRFANMLRRPVIDKTGLTKKYDFTLEFTPELSGLQLPPPPPGAPPAESIASTPATPIEVAVEKQLGLKLTSTKGMLEVIVVDHAEKVPTEN